MWNNIVRILFRYRPVNIIIIFVLTAFMAYKAVNVQLSYELAKMLPANNEANVEYEKFKQMFGEDGNVFVAGVQDEKMFDLSNFKDWYEAAEEIKKLDGI